jgi:hypothetical protein
LPRIAGRGEGDEGDGEREVDALSITAAGRVLAATGRDGSGSLP